MTLRLFGRKCFPYMLVFDAREIAIQRKCFSLLTENKHKWKTFFERENNQNRFFFNPLVLHKLIDWDRLFPKWYFLLKQGIFPLIFYIGSVCFAVKYFLQNIFRFADVCFTVKWCSNENNFRWPKNPLFKFGKWFTPNFFVNHFPKTHASSPAPSAISSAQHCKIFFRAFSKMQPNIEKKNHFPWNYFHLKTFCNEKYFTSK